MKKTVFVLSAGLLLAVAGCRKEKEQPVDTIQAPAVQPSVEVQTDVPVQSQKKETMTITSPEFENGGRIPIQHTADGPNYSPALYIQNVPKGTGSLVLIMDDPLAAQGTWVHWLVWNIPADVVQIMNGGVRREGTMEGTNSWGNIGYGGPAPPSGIHRYFFKLYALDRMLDIQPGTDIKTVEAAMEGHILEQAELIGIYSRE